MAAHPAVQKLPELPHTIVGIDVETTSLDPADGDIIEVAAIRYELSQDGTKTGREVEELVLLASPRQPLTDQITAITGITNDMVKEKPPFSALKSQVQEFIGDDLLFAHNANFDISYLTSHGLTITQPVWDTFTLAGAAWPTAPSYNLGTIAQQIGVAVPAENNDASRTEHSAGYDVRLTWELLQAIRRQLQLPADQYEVVVRLLQESKQSHYIPLFRIKNNRPDTGNEREKGEAGGAAISGKTPVKKNHYSPAQDAASILGTGGLLEQTIPAFTARKPQVDMGKTVAGYLQNGGLGLIEAGTGTGKTFAYIAPAIVRIEQYKRKSGPPGAAAVPIVVSTHTKTLQDQLMRYDVPQLCAALGSTARVSILKGRRNYLCTHRLEQALTRPGRPHPAGRTDAWLLIKLLCWLQQNDSGDLEQLNVSHQDSRLLRHLHADSISCRQICAVQRPECPYQRARRAARQADLLIVNHAMLVQHAEDAALPAAHIIIDEAHHLLAAARDATRRDLSEQRLAEVIGALAQLAPEEGQSGRHIRTEAAELTSGYQQILKDIYSYMQAHTAVGTIRITNTLRRSAPWQKIVQQVDVWESQLAFTLGLLRSTPAPGKRINLLEDAIRQAETAATEVSRFIHGDPERIQWLEVSQYRQNYELKLHDVALSVKDSLARMYQSVNSCILTSATLTVSGNFSYIKKRTGTEEAGEHRFASPFNIRDNMLIYIIEDSKDGVEQSYEQYIAATIGSTATLLQGRTLGLFTSHAMVKAVYEKLVKELNKEGIKLFAQRMTGGRHNMVERFRRRPDSVLLGTYSFWEGIDVPGDSLSAVVIPKLPFMPPHDPVTAAVAESEGLSAFQHLALPDMLLRLRQGIGRLLRTTTDRGAVILCDSRIVKQEYGSEVLNSLPPATVKVGPSSDLAAALTDWFGEHTLARWHGNRRAKKK
ncbi:MAG: hypothetical protein COT71_02665 [Candidatus Andersenbacteria bacterium CG10_big_fil_rev_8_21_14_0_10_54_11]|uniref:Helicase ATP-binding domain-containing protein n=1 Tax=Candidatus Andersenbacteria bacterium CG10_big_fil_rev_8_21_14_0_10_54_11 TaxID=1974485 RepID=A0A2M6WZ98_9BACT|nr:MAG: hypothetical protein COT71_02665 [Candidatus Andersenbacteria bacterium CG10_big_fil_rev_8_21_14_0_10_54_11]